MSIHQPQACYLSTGYTMDAAPLQRTFTENDQPAQLWTARFSRQEATGLVHLRIDWSWFGAGQWQAPTAPRWSFASLPFLYKLYLIHELPPRPERTDNDVSAELLRQLLPVISNTLRSNPPVREE
jgi:hypothetical protein